MSFTTMQAIGRELGGTKQPTPMRPWRWVVIGLISGGMVLARYMAHH
jgi:hypothetical protein